MQLVGINQLRELEKSISSGKKDSVLGFLRIGQALSKIKELDLWRFSEAESFSSYMEKVQGMKRSWGYALISVFESFGPLIDTNQDLQCIDVTRCVRLLPHVTKDNADELLHMGAVVDTKGFENNLKNLAGKVATDDPHDHVFQLVQFQQCTICGQKTKAIVAADV
jgi:hypothetical protein